jgi:elongator complex protein 1
MCIGNNRLAMNINSFTLHSHYLLFTTLTHRLHCIPLCKLHSLIAVETTTIGRSIERGSRLICASSNQSTRVILQIAPRGNIESIHPRPLVLHILRQLIDQRLYVDVLLLMKRHRIDMNLIYDHNIQV